QALNTGEGDQSIGLRYYQLNFYAQQFWRVSRQVSLSLGLRYEYNTPPSELNERIERTFNSPLLSLAPALTQFIDGRAKIFDPDRNNFAPRVGFAYSPELFVNNKSTVIRGGFGVFYDQILGAVVSQSRNVYPTFLTLNFGGGPSFGQFPLTFDNPSRQSIGVPGLGFVPLVVPGTVDRYNPAIPLNLFFDVLNRTFPSAFGATLPTRKLETPRALHYSFTVEQQVGRDLTFSLAYVGTRGHDLLRFTTPNLGPALTLGLTNFDIAPRDFAFPIVFGQVNNPARPLAGIGAINQFETSARSNYDSLQIQGRGRLARALQFQIAYTFSRTTDDVSDVFDLAGAYVLPQNSRNLPAEFGPANFDIPHQLAFGFNYELPKQSSGPGVFRKLLNGIEISGTGRFRSGQPFTVNSTIDVNLDGNLTDRLNTVQGIDLTGDGRQPLRLTTANTLALLAPFGQDGQIGRNTFRAGGSIDLDISVRKNWVLAGGEILTTRIDVFNLPNRSNFGIPIRFLEAPGFGQATNTIIPGRRVQFGLKVTF